MIMSTFERIRKLFADKLDIKEDGITLQTRFDSLEIDSIDLVEFLFAIEEEFRIKDIPYRDVPLDTVSDLIALVDRFVAEQQGNAPAEGERS